MSEWASFDIILTGFGRRIIKLDQWASQVVGDGVSGPAATWGLFVDDADLSAHSQSLDTSLIPRRNHGRRFPFPI